MQTSKVLSAVWLVVLGAACSTSAQPTPQTSPTDVVATVGPAAVTLGDVDKIALKQTVDNFGDLTLVQAIYEARRTALEEVVADRLIAAEAKTLGVEVPALVDREIEGKITAPTDADVEAWYEANRARVQGGTIEQLRDPIRALLARDRRQTARNAYVDLLKAKTPVKILLEPPRTVVADAGRPAKGSTSAPIQIVEFSDFQCPFCLRATSIVKEVLSKYGDRIRLVYRHYPLPSHPNARPAAEASMCANEQNQFWAYHDRLFASADKLADDDLKRYAADLGLDAAKFNACFDAHKFQAEVAADMSAGTEAGVSGTPAFFINGRMLGGAQPFEAFEAIIEDELGRGK